MLPPVATAQGGSQSARRAFAPADIPALVEECTKLQLEDYRHAAWAFRYKVHRVDNREDSVRDLVESRDGNIARTLIRNGQPLTPEQDAAEIARLKRLQIEDVQKRQHSAANSERYGVELISVLPKAMTYTLTAGQPQLPQFTHAQVVLDYVPNSQFHPANTVQSLLAGVAGRLWIDADTHHLLRVEINITRNLNLMFGMLARVYQGGTLKYEQQPAGGGHYLYSRIETDVKLRELMVRVVPYKSIMTSSDVEYLPIAPTFDQAREMLIGARP